MTAPFISPALDPRLACMGSVSANCYQFENGQRSLDDAWMLLVDVVDAVIGPCPCYLIPDTPPVAPPPKRQRPTPQVSIEAIKQIVRQRGVSALEAPGNRQRLSQFDSEALAEIDRWLHEKGFSK